ncbi:MAG: hypothetical protein ACRDVG_02680, partial [Jatrophihabitantaceae bacterium]
MYLIDTNAAARMAHATVRARLEPLITGGGPRPSSNAQPVGFGDAVGFRRPSFDNWVTEILLRGSCPGRTTDAGEAVGGHSQPSANLLRHLDDD